MANIEISLFERSKTLTFRQHSLRKSSSSSCKKLKLKFSFSILFGIFFGISCSFKLEQSKVVFDISLHCAAFEVTKILI